MNHIRIWKGTKRFALGNDLSNYVYVEFEGEVLGSCWEEYDARGVETTFFRDSKNRIVVHCVKWSRWENEAVYGEVHVFPSLEDAAVEFQWELERAGLIPDEVEDQ